mmetsp:Transcript_33954/g.44802  ORF Transcript_33954/g.44802 Transcript_33954/m.44802 type:complete len:423 (-) Transcript_33954:442-1710(-)|eukprot:CAMPEP_0117755064 /NCGR_PEP_ID=MMETSP0947-20121206/13219_1 /TAXON_ID=44440 /ORGANISM="Chattonella subsalsa, Strain CCMP2191" /LENGTH=422 /DNA_ID=CAMNT_0005574307 /DNA_START=120 /DNA_END=1388 /DNA_ORIENTATION=-
MAAWSKSIAVLGGSLSYFYFTKAEVLAMISNDSLIAGFSELSYTTKGVVVVSSATTLYLVLRFLETVSGTYFMSRTFDFIGTFFGQEKKRGIKVDNWIDKYNDLHDDSKGGVDDRNSNYAALVNSYYELATLFYEWGWGTSFHFAYRRPFESFAESIRRHEYYIAGRLGAKKGDKLLDCGCGIGGPMRNITRFTGADVTGLTINDYQVQRGNQLCKKEKLDTQCRSVQGDFMKMPFEDNSFDGVYAIEATCHAPDRLGVYGEIMRVLKPGATFACYEWCLTDKYDAKNVHHRKIKKAIEEGDGLPDMIPTWEVDEALKKVGFEVVETRDMALDPNPGGKVWYLPLMPSWNIFTQRFQFTGVGMWLTTNLLWVMEKLWLAPAGTSKVQTMLQQGGIGCSQGGHTGTFTPMYLAVVRKPLKPIK